MTDTRVLDNFLRHLGEGEPAETFRDIEIWRHSRPEYVSFATHGLSDRPITAVAPQELVCSVEHGQDGAAVFLLHRAIDLVLQNGRGLVNGDLIRNDRPLLERTRIHGILVSAHPYAGDDFDAVFGDDGSVVAEIQTLIPLTDTELRRAGVDGVDALIDILEITDPPLLDVTRLV